MAVPNPAEAVPSFAVVGPNLLGSYHPAGPIRLVEVVHNLPADHTLDSVVDSLVVDCIGCNLEEAHSCLPVGKGSVDKGFVGKNYVGRDSVGDFDSHLAIAEDRRSGKRCF